MLMIRAFFIDSLFYLLETIIVEEVGEEKSVSIENF